MTDFEFYQGDDVIPYYVITDTEGNPVDVTGMVAATWVATPMSSSTPILTKHLEGMIIDYDPTVPGASIKNCIFIHLSPNDLGNAGEIGTFKHELRITLNEMQSVVYPPVGTTATFAIVPSLTWDTGVTPPAPRIIEEEPEEQVSKLKRIPKLPAKKVG